MPASKSSSAKAKTSTASKTASSKAATSKSATSKSATSKSATSKSATSKSATSKSASKATYRPGEEAQKDLKLFVKDSKGKTLGEINVPAGHRIPPTRTKKADSYEKLK